MLGHDLFGLERYSPHTRHMVMVDILTSDSPVGCPCERYRFFLSGEEYRNAKKSAARGEIKIRSHAAVRVGRLYHDKKLLKEIKARAYYDLRGEIVSEERQFKKL